MKTPPNETARNKENPERKFTIGEALAYAVPLIAVLQSPALAVQRTTQAQPGSAANIPVSGLMMDPPTLMAAGAAIASIGAYRLMKMRGRKGPDPKDSADQ